MVLSGCGDIVPGPARTEPIDSLSPIAATGQRLVRIDDIGMSADGTVVTLSFIGSPEFVADDPCTAEYGGKAEVVDDVLEVAVSATIDRYEHGTPLAANVNCTDLGYQRSVAVELGEPFAGGMVRDLAGGVWFTDAPAGLVELSGLPPGWTLQDELDLPESPTGRWMRVYISPDGNGRLELIQAFNASANVGGGGEQRTVIVGDVEGRLYRHAPSGELVLVWRPGPDGLALVGFEADFTAEELIALAESIQTPNG